MCVAASLSILAILLTQFEVISRKEYDLKASLIANKVVSGKVLSMYQLTTQLPREMTESECRDAVQSKLRVENPYKESNGQYTFHYQPAYKKNKSHCGVTIEFSTNSFQLTPRNSISVIYIGIETKQNLIHSLLEK